MEGPLGWYAAWASERWSDLPWRVFDSTVSQRMPTFAESELVFAVVALVALMHAGTRPPGSVRRQYLLLWCCSLVGGAANDIVFSWLPVVDNFWREIRPIHAWSFPGHPSQHCWCTALPTE